MAFVEFTRITWEDHEKTRPADAGRYAVDPATGVALVEDDDGLTVIIAGGVPVSVKGSFEEVKKSLESR